MLATDGQKTARTFEALPHIPVDEVIDLCEIVGATQGKADIYSLSREFSGYPAGLLICVDAAKALGLITVRDGMISLTAIGKGLASSDAETWRRVLREQIMGLTIFRWVVLSLTESSGTAPGEVFRQELLRALPESDAWSTFWTLTNWGEYAGLFTYAEATDEMKLVVSRSG
jgi:hypothetical protein